MPMSPSRQACLDDERIAALVDRTLPADVEAAARAHLADCAACCALFVAVLRGQQELERDADETPDAPAAEAQPTSAPEAPSDTRDGNASAEGAKPLPFVRPQRLRRPTPGVWLPWAAALALSLGGAGSYWQSTRPRAVDLADLVAPLSTNATAIGHLWEGDVRRGGGATDALERESFRFGVLSVDLRLSLAARDVPRSRLRLQLAAQQLEGLELMTEDAAFFRGAAERATEPAAFDGIQAEVERRLPSVRERFDPVFLSFGHWAEAARLAAAARDTAFFAIPAHRRVPAWVRKAGGPRLLPELGTELAAIESQWPGAKSGNADWPALEARLAALLRRAGA